MSDDCVWYRKRLLPPALRSLALDMVGSVIHRDDMRHVLQATSLTEEDIPIVFDGPFELRDLWPGLGPLRLQH